MTAPDYIGKPCSKHPGLGGLRYKPSYACVACHKFKAIERTKSDPNHAEKQRVRARNVHSELKSAVMSVYGGVCFRCKESDIDVLTIDHINQKGADHRRELNIGRGRSSGSNKTYRWLIGNGFPEGYRVACFNCNHKVWLEHLRGGR